jgi:hypothetical protein
LRKQQHPCALLPLEEPLLTCLPSAAAINKTKMSPPRYIMCQKLVRAAAEKEAETAAASILVEMSLDAKASASASTLWSGPGAVAKATGSIATTIPNSIVKDAPLAAEAVEAAEAASSFGGVRALCAAAKLVRSTLRFVSLRVLHEEARQEDDALVEAVVPAVPELEPAGGDAYKHRHSWRRRRNVSVIVVVASTTEEEARAKNVPGPATGDVAHKYRHSWRRRKVPGNMVAASGDDAPTTEETCGGASSTERHTRAVRVSVVVAGVIVGDCEAALVTDNSVDEDNHVDALSPEAPDHVVPAAAGEAVVPPTLPVVESNREGWQERQKRRGRGERYAAILAAVRSPPRRRHGGAARRRA